MGSPLSQARASPRAQLLNSSIPAGLQRTGETGRGGGKDERRKRVFSCDTEARINATARKTAYRNGGIGASQPSLKFPLCSGQTAPTSWGEGTRALLPSLSWEQDQSLDLQKSSSTDRCVHPTGLHHPTLPSLTHEM